MLAKIRLWTLLYVVFSMHAALAADVDYSKSSNEQLIDDLTLIDAQAPGIDGAAIYGGFIAVDAPVVFQGGLLGAPLPTAPPQMRELVRRGMDALPVLIAHLNDARPTKLSVGNEALRGDHTEHGIVFGDKFDFTTFDDEYDPRSRAIFFRHRRKFLLKDFTGKYNVKVGDVCYSLIGQIVNRKLLPVRYQPSGGLIVNSPIVYPDLIKRVKHDWGNATPDTLKDSLLADVRNNKDIFWFQWALTRLRFYYPDTYSTLHGKDLSKKNEFEKQEADEKSSK